MILTTLIERKVPFCVLVSFLTLRGVDMHIKEYHVICCESDRDKLKKLRFKRQKKGLVERQLSEDEITHFKQINDSFVKVIHRRDGRVYELKSLPFKPYYNESRRS
jgi:hypothetical protein